jgi:flagellin
MASLYAQKNLSTAQTDLASSVQKLSSGKRINSAKDDAAGYAVSEAVKATKNITDQSIQNTQDAISLAQTAEGALDVVGKMLQRMLTLTTQKENSTLTSSQTTSINGEINTLVSEISQIRSRTRFQGGSASIFGQSFTFTTGSGTSSPTQTTITIADLTAVRLAGGASATVGSTAGNGATGSASAVVGTTTEALVLGANATIAAGTSVWVNGVDTGWRVASAVSNSTAVSLVAANTSVSTIADGASISFQLGSSSTSSLLMDAVQANISDRATLGTYQNQLNYIVDNMQTLSNNLADAQSRIIDTDYASETAKLTRGQILQQAATSMLAQANQMPNVILTLLK